MPTDTPKPPPVGPELDRAVHEALRREWSPWRYSTHLGDAFAALRETKTAFYDITRYLDSDGEHHHCAIEVPTEDSLVHSGPYPTLPEAICRAVLAWAAAREVTRTRTQPPGDGQNPEETRG